MTAVPSAACSELYPMEENLYEPLDPPITAPSRKHSPDPPGTAWVSHRDVAMQPKLGSCGPHQDPLSPPSVSPARQSCPQDRLLLVGAVALGVSVLLNVFLLSLGTRQSEYGVCGAQQGGPQPWGMTLGHRVGVLGGLHRGSLTLGDVDTIPGLLGEELGFWGSPWGLPYFRG